jgi:hypothetical protein
MRLAMMAVAGAACLTVGCATTPTEARLVTPRALVWDK